MDKLNIGDIKKFSDGTIGVIISIESNAYEVLQTNGKSKYVSFDLSYVSPRLRPELRKLLEAIGQSKVDYENARKAVSKAYIEAGRKGDEFERLKKKLLTFDEMMDLSEFKNLLIKQMGGVYDKLLGNDYLLSVNFSVHSLSVEFAKSSIVKKYASPENTPFLTREYDGSLLIERYAGSYADALKKWGSKCVTFNSASPVYMSNSKDFYISDKNTLMFNHKVVFTMLDVDLSEKTISKFLSNIKIV